MPGQYSRHIAVVLFALTLAFVLSLPSQACASDQPTPSKVSQQDLKDLLVTLESETGRAELVSNIKTLIEIQESQKQQTDTKPSKPKGFAAALGIDQTIKDMTRRYEAFLKRNNLAKGPVSRTLISSAALLIFIGIVYLFRKLTGKVSTSLQNLKSKYRLQHNRFDYYVKTCRYLGDFIAVFILVFTLNAIWGVTWLDFLHSETALAIFGTVLNIFLIVAATALAWELLYTASENYINSLDTGFDTRIQTLLPLVRNVGFMVLATLVGFIVLAELGVNIMPLLAGAGVLGIAIGFGAQNLVKDFINGFFILFEDLIQIGDVVRLSGRRGVVEEITIRKITMRDLDGTVYTIPYSEVTLIENLTKLYSYYVADIGVAYREDTDEVVKHLRAVDEDMRNDSEYGPLMLEPIDIMGVDKFADSAVIIRTRLKTEPSKQWKVGREFNRRMKKRFDKHNIEIPFPHQTLYFGEDKKGEAPAANINIKNKKTAPQ